MKEGVELDIVMTCVSRQCPSNHLEEFREILGLK